MFDNESEGIVSKAARVICISATSRSECCGPAQVRHAWAALRSQHQVAVFAGQATSLSSTLSSIRCSGAGAKSGSSLRACSKFARERRAINQHGLFAFGPQQVDRRSQQYQA